MTDILTYAILGAAVAGLFSGLVWVAHRYWGLSDKGQRIGQGLAIVLAIVAVRTVPVDNLFQDKDAERERAVEAQLLRIPTYLALKESYPTDYAAIQASLAEGLANDASEMQMIGKVRPIYLAVLERQMPKAGDANLRRMLKVTLEQGEFLRGRNVKFCHELLNGGGISFNPASVFPPALANQEADVAAAILRETADAPDTAPAPLPDAELDALALAAFEALPSAEQESLARMNYTTAAANSQSEYAASCGFLVEMLKVVGTGDDASVARRFRGLMAVPKV